MCTDKQFMENIPIQIIVHHTAAVAPIPQFEAINEWHKARKFPISSLGFYVGYHYVIEKDGTVQQARKDNEEGAHTYGQNFNSIGICLVGDFDFEWPTHEQIVSVGALIETKQREHSIPIEALYPHIHYNNTSCYGTRLPDDWAKQVLAWFELAKAENVNQQTLEKLHDEVYTPKITKLNIDHEK